MKTIIVDDEEAIREGLKILLQTYPHVEVVAGACDIEDAQYLIELHEPELVFLDIKLKDSTGFDLLDRLSYTQFKVIFITAFDEYAIRAFKYNAFDYLLKPIDPEELAQTFDRLSFSTVTYDDHQSSMPSPKQQEHLVVKTAEQLHLLDLKDIVRCEADQGYAHIYLRSGKRIISAKPLKEYHGLLPEASFIRIHQSHLISADHIARYMHEGKVVMKDGTVLPVSVRRRKLIRHRLNLS